MKNKQQTSSGGDQSRQDNGRQQSGGQQPIDRPTGDNTEKDPDQWVTGNESMTGAQRSYLKTLSDEAGEPFDENITKAEASKRIDELQHKTGRGLSS
jgi:hypothetical protein